MKTHELLPCPFCSADEVIEYTRYSDRFTPESFFMRCHACNAEGPSAKTPKMAHRKWNTRSQQAAAVSLGSAGGLKGGNARAASLSPERRSQIARKAAKARWKKAISKAKTTLKHKS